MSDPRPLPPEAEQWLDAHCAQGRQARIQGDTAEAERHFLAAWDAIPEPKLDHEYADSLSVGLTEFYRDMGRPADALPWLARAAEAYGEDEPGVRFLAGSVHYAAAEYDAAYAVFDELFKAYRQRPFQGEHPGYLAFYHARAEALREGRQPVDPPSPELSDDDLPDDEEPLPPELPDDIYEEVEALAEEGNSLSDDGDDAGAEAVWRQALDLLPEPRTEWEAHTWLCASIGEACYLQGRHADAKAMFFDALNGPGGVDNPFVHYMLGKALFHEGDLERAADELLRAYMLDSVEIFDGDEEEGADMLQILQDRGLADE